MSDTEPPPESSDETSPPEPTSTTDDGLWLPESGAPPTVDGPEGEQFEAKPDAPVDWDSSIESQATEPEPDETVPLPPEIVMRSRIPYELDLVVTVPSGGYACAFALPQRLFRCEQVSWDGLASVNWLGQWYDSPLDPREWPESQGPDLRPEHLRTMYRVYRVGEPVCLVAFNPTGAPLEVRLRATGESVI